MDQAVDRPEAEACAKWTLGGTTRVGLIGLLIMSAALASLLTIDIPVPASGGADAAASFVPASDRWIVLGASSRSEPPPLQSDLPQRAAAIDRVPVPSRDEARAWPPRKPRGVVPGNPGS